MALLMPSRQPDLVDEEIVRFGGDENPSPHKSGSSRLQTHARSVASAAAQEESVACHQLSSLSSFP